MPDRLLNQFRRIYSDYGKDDVDFTADEERLKLAQDKVKQATQELVRASERLNTVAMGVDPPEGQMH